MSIKYQSLLGLSDITADSISTETVDINGNLNVDGVSTLNQVVAQSLSLPNGADKGLVLTSDDTGLGAWQEIPETELIGDATGLVSNNVVNTLAGGSINVSNIVLLDASQTITNKDITAIALKLPNDAGNGKMLGSDNDGNATWKVIPPVILNGDATGNVNSTVVNTLGGGVIQVDSLVTLNDAQTITNKYIQANSLQLPNGAQNGHVLTSDYDGNSSWQPPSTNQEDPTSFDPSVTYQSGALVKFNGESMYSWDNNVRILPETATYTYGTVLKFATNGYVSGLTMFPPSTSTMYYYNMCLWSADLDGSNSDLLRTGAFIPYVADWATCWIDPIEVYKNKLYIVSYTTDIGSSRTALSLSATSQFSQVSPNINILPQHVRFQTGAYVDLFSSYTISTTDNYYCDVVFSPKSPVTSIYKKVGALARMSLMAAAPPSSNGPAPPSQRNWEFHGTMFSQDKIQALPSAIPDSIVVRDELGGFETKKLKITNGAAASKVLTSDEVGNASWQSITTNPYKGFYSPSTTYSVNDLVTYNGQSIYKWSVTPVAYPNTSLNTIGNTMSFQGAGKITALTMWVAQASPVGGYTLKLYSANMNGTGSTLVTSVAGINKTTPGWITVPIPPVTVNTNLQYGVWYDTSGKYYPDGSTIFSQVNPGMVTFLTARYRAGTNNDLFTTYTISTNTSYVTDVVFEASTGTMTLYQNTVAAPHPPSLLQNWTVILTGFTDQYNFGKATFDKVDAGMVTANRNNQIANKIISMYDGFGTVPANAIDFSGFGINNNTLRYQVPATQNHRFYSGSVNALTINDGGLYFVTSGGTASPLNYYEEYDHVTSFSFSSTQSTNAFTVKLVRINNVVTAFFPLISINLTGSPVACSMVTPFPSRFRTPNAVALTMVHTYARVMRAGVYLGGVGIVQPGFGTATVQPGMDGYQGFAVGQTIVYQWFISWNLTIGVSS